MMESCQDPPFQDLLEMLGFEYVLAQHHPGGPPSPWLDRTQLRAEPSQATGSSPITCVPHGAAWDPLPGHCVVPARRMAGKQETCYHLTELAARGYLHC